MDKNGPSEWFRKLRRKKGDAVEAEIKSIVSEGHESGALLENEAEMIHNIFEFGDKEARDVMTPRQKVVGIDVSDNLRDAMKMMLEDGFSRYPLYQDDLDNIVGILHLKDAMRYYMDRPDTPLKSIGREAYFVHPTQSIDELFSNMQTQKIHMAIVVDEYGQTEGIVAMEDILEVIVGDILDEYDEEERMIVKLGNEDAYLVKGMMRIEDLEEYLEIELPVEDVDTVNGFMLNNLGHLPKEGEKIEITYGGYLFKALDVHERMITQIKCTKIPRKEEQAEE